MSDKLMLNIRIMSKIITVFLILFVGILCQVSAQEEGCSKPRVGVVLWELTVEDNDEFFNFLNQQYAFHTEENWIWEIEQKVLLELEINSPETEFIRVSGEVPDNCDYYFGYTMELIGAGKDIEIPGTDGMVRSEYTAYYMTSRLASNPACGIPGYILGIETTDDDRDIQSTIEKNVAAYGNIADQIENWEESHLVPAREPKILVTNSWGYVSPLEEERSLDIKMSVINCKMQTVYNRKEGQMVFLPRRTDRGENKPTKGFPQHLIVTDNDITLSIIEPVGASATYTLNKGLDPIREKIRIKTCGLSQEVIRYTEFSIYGLEIDVKPDRSQIFTNELTDIKLIFNKTDPDRNKYPVEGRKLNVEITGIIDGAISPKGEYTTDEKGEVLLTYRAGIKDKKITITASYQPHEYPEKVIGEASIDVIESNWEWSGTMTIEKLERFDCELEVQKDNLWKKENLHELSATRATVNILAENIDDSPPGFNIDMGENLIVNGFMKCELNNTEIIDGRKSGVSPYTSHHEETLVGEDLFDLTHKNLNLMFTTVMGDAQNDKSLEELGKMLETLETGELDQAKIEAFGKKLEESMVLQESGDSKINVFLTIFGDCKCKAILSQTGWAVKNGERTTTNESESFDLDIGGGVALEFTADYVRKKDGSATITGHYSKTTPITVGLREGCPPKEETITCTLNLSKRPIQ